MAASQHRLEQRSHLLATRMVQRKNAIRDAITPSGQAPPFSVTMTRNEALDWWTANWKSPVGEMVLKTWSEEQKLALEAALGVYHAENPRPFAMPQTPYVPPPDNVPPLPQILPPGQVA